ncbi:(2Fe-2S)-binding protein [Paenarthrobacter aromaticivorans]|uniref:(2Fe-2S)-binding protein n=1 Tax=Paenarthrobacter aromaticivorans TaxID=2849150 RepID=A0ABS6HZY1_9MICC|nr:(2Fe-2S)-binding protein [Paenarthrobacter sp. MMS21-TAE1-1]MBU8864944.1 (2Fe-2S)-binding protein [Paenarthrobacter sp. MMS21-TAE1-1]
MSKYSPGDEPAGTPGEVTVSFNGRPITTSAGQSVGSALVTNGITAWRDTRKQARPRGLFCGIGVCFDCLVSVDGIPNQRACLVEVCEGMKIEGCWEGTDAAAVPANVPAGPEGGRE